MKSGECSIEQLVEKIRGRLCQTRRRECSIKQPTEKVRAGHWQMRGEECNIEQSLELVKHKDERLNVTGKTY